MVQAELGRKPPLWNYGPMPIEPVWYCCRSKQGCQMDIAGFFANIASSYKAKYISLAQQFNPISMPDPIQPPDLQAPVGEPEASGAPVDEYLPTADATSTETPGTVTPNTSEIDRPTGEVPTSEVPVEQKPDGTYYYQRQARLDYQLNLEFDLAAISRTVESMAEGGSGSIEELVAGGFGLHVGFDIKGMQRVQTNMT